VAIFGEQFIVMLRTISPGIPARTFVTSFVSGADQERKVVAGGIPITHPKPATILL
jgi:hypothetical protein